MEADLLHIYCNCKMQFKKDRSKRVHARARSQKSHYGSSYYKFYNLHVVYQFIGNWARGFYFLG